MDKSCCSRRLHTPVGETNNLRFVNSFAIRNCPNAGTQPGVKSRRTSLGRTTGEVAAQPVVCSPGRSGSPADLADPQSWNAYAYVIKRSLADTDPSGLQSCPGSRVNCSSQSAQSGVVLPKPEGEGQHQQHLTLEKNSDTTPCIQKPTKPDLSTKRHFDRLSDATSMLVAIRSKRPALKRIVYCAERWKEIEEVPQS